MPDNIDVSQELVAPVVEQPESHLPTEDQQEKNWGALRQVVAESKEETARVKRQLEEMQRLMDAQRNPIAPPPSVEEDPWEGLEDNDLIEVKKGRHVIAKTVTKEVKRALQEERQKQMSDPNYLEQKARQRHADFDQVVSQENIDSIIKKTPSIHSAILKSDDPIEAAYEYITNSAAYATKKTTQAQNMVEKAKVAENLKKPKSPNTVTPSSSVSTASGFGKLSKEQQKQLWIEHNKKLGRSC